MILDSVQQYITNRLPEIKESTACGIIGGKPSQSARSPAVWNYVFQQQGMDAIFLPFDVDSQKNLEQLAKVLRESDFVKCVSVTVPYKETVMKYLDSIDEKAKNIGAVNFIHRPNDGELVGYNTDGLGGLKSLLEPSPGQTEPFVDTLEGKTVLLIGAGGAAKALAHYIGTELGEDGQLRIKNRNSGKAIKLAQEISQNYGVFADGSDESIGPPAHLRTIDLVVNATMKGQAGIVKAGERFTCLEPYSALYSANPATMKVFSYAEWFDKSQEDVVENNRVSARTAGLLPKKTMFFDAVHTPIETVMLKHARWSEHKTLNGKGMNVCQAAAAFKMAFPGADYKKVLELMYSAP